jgi:hypothetical protein
MTRKIGILSIILSFFATVAANRGEGQKGLP